MKTKDFMNELNSKSVDDLQKDLVAAKKELFNLLLIIQNQVEP